MVMTASPPVQSLASALLRATWRRENLDAACDNTPMSASDRNRKTLEAAFERELKSYEATRLRSTSTLATNRSPSVMLGRCLHGLGRR